MKDLNEMWDAARRLMTNAGENMSSIPASNSEAFLQFAHTATDRYGNLKYVALASTYNPENPILDQSQEAINNLLFDFYQARLEDYDTFKERYTPGGPLMLKAAKAKMLALRYASAEDLSKLESLKDLEELSKRFDGYSYPYDPTELSTIAHYQTYNALYDKLIGVAANQNINQRLTALLNKLALTNPIKFASLVECVDPAAGKDIKQRVINGIDTELLNTEFLSSAVDAVKDALLEYFGIDDNNFNAACLLSKIGASPTDIGLLLNQPVVVRAMAIIKESNMSKNISSALDEALQEDGFSGKNYEHDMQVYKEFEGTDIHNNSNRDKFVNSNNLVKYISIFKSEFKKGSRDEFLKGQYAVAHLMKEIVAAASELSDQVSISKTTSTNSVQSDLGSIENTEMKVINFITNFGSKDSKFDVEVCPSTDGNGEVITRIIDPFMRFNDTNTAETVLENSVASPYCMEQVAYSSVMNFVDEVIGAIFPYRTSGFKSLQTSLAGLTQRRYLSADICNLVHKDAMLFLIERMTDVFREGKTVDVVSPSGKELKTGFTQRVFYKELFPTYFEAVMANNRNALENGITSIDYTKIPLLAALSKEAEGYTKGKKNSSTRDYNQVLKFAGIGGLKGYQKDILKESWEAMYASGDPLLMDMAKHLFMYSYYSRGFSFGDTSFMSLAPVQLKKNIFGGEYSMFFNRVFNTSTSNGNTLHENGLGNDLSNGISVKDFLKAFILNHSAEYQFTKTLDKYQKSKLKAITPGGMTTENKETKDSTFTDACKSFTIDFNNDKIANSSLKSLGTALKDEKGEVIGYKFTPCIRIGDALYICDVNLNEENANFNTSMSKSITYYRMDLPLGLDYSKPQLYGTRDAEILKQAKDSTEIVQAIREMCLAYQAQQLPTIQEPGDDNTHGGELQYSDINAAVNTVMLNIDSLVALFKHQFWHVLNDFIDSLLNSLDIIRFSLDGGIMPEGELNHKLLVISELLASTSLSNPMLIYINDIEAAITNGVVVFDFETTHAQDSDSRDRERCGIALIGAVVIKEGLIITNNTINSFITPQLGHYTDAVWTDEVTGFLTVNPIHEAYQLAISNGTTIDETTALVKLSNMLRLYQRTFGFNSVSFDSWILNRRIKAARGANSRLGTVRHFDAMTVARLALDGRGLDHYNRETVTRWLLYNKPEFTLELESLKQLLGSTTVKSHDAINDVLETYCIIKHLMQELRESNVVTNSIEYKALVNSLLNIKQIIAHQIKVQEQQLNLNPSLNQLADLAPNLIDNNGRPVCG